MANTIKLGTVVSNHPIDYTPIEEIYIRKLKKTVPDGNNGWEERIFYSITKDQSKIEKWLLEKYGKGQYCNTWWRTFGKVVMSEKIYTHYMLCV